jgi:hypothetical protein
MPFPTRTSLVSAIMAAKPAAFLEEHMYDCVPFVFSGNRTAYITWKRVLAGKLDVDPACLLIVGSAAVGRSLSPTKNLKEFDASSDIDVAVISAYHFTLGWRYLRSNPARRLSLDPRTRNAWNDHEKTYIYSGTIATDRLLGIMPFAHPWAEAKKVMKTVPPSMSRDVNFRIYTDFEALRAYQIRSLTSLQEKVISTEPHA